jgi:hypothetical protein
MARAELVWIWSMVVVCGCAGRPAPPVENGASAPPPDAAGDTGNAARPAIDVERLLAGEPSTTGLPARSDDQVAVAVVSGDGGRGNPNLALEILRVPDGAVVDRIVVLTADEVDASSPAVLRPVVEERARRVEELLASGEFAPLELLGEAPAAAAPETVARLVGADLWLGFARGHLVARRAGGPTLFDGEIPAPPSPAVSGEEVECSGPPALTGAWVDAGRALLVARLVDLLPELCGEPDDWFFLAPLAARDGEPAIDAASAVVDCARIDSPAYLARLAAAGVSLDGVECGEGDDRPR